GPESRATVVLHVLRDAGSDSFAGRDGPCRLPVGDVGGVYLERHSENESEVLQNRAGLFRGLGRKLAFARDGAGCVKMGRGVRAVRGTGHRPGGVVGAAAPGGAGGGGAGTPDYAALPR